MKYEYEEKLKLNEKKFMSQNVEIEELKRYSKQNNITNTIALITLNVLKKGKRKLGFRIKQSSN